MDTATAAYTHAHIHRARLEIATFVGTPGRVTPRVIARRVLLRAPSTLLFSLSARPVLISDDNNNTTRAAPGVAFNRCSRTCSPCAGAGADKPPLFDARFRRTAAETNGRGVVGGGVHRMFDVRSLKVAVARIPLTALTIAATSVKGLLHRAI